MSVQTLECSISAVLMKRFLDGDSLPQELLEGLEQHLKVCPGCKKIVNSEKETIEKYLDGPKQTDSLMGKLLKKAKKPQPETPKSALLGQTTTVQHESPPGLAALKSPKVLMLSLALGAVLVLMSTVLRNPMAMLGPKAASEDSPAIQKEEKSTKEEEPVLEEEKDETHTTESGESHDPEPGTEAETVEPESHGTTNSEPADSQPIPTQDNHPQTPDKPTPDRENLVIVGGPKDTSASHDSPKADKPAPSHPPKKKTTTRPRSSGSRSTGSKSGGSGIKVYDANGNPIR